MANGPGRSGRGGRGGGRSGPRTFQGRTEKGGFPKSIETWDPNGDKEGEPNANGRVPKRNITINLLMPCSSTKIHTFLFPSGADYGMGEWNDSFPAAEDWDNEEYTGSLADTKVFTPSAVQRPSAAEVVEAMDREMAAVAKGALSGQAGSLEAAASMLPQSLTSSLPAAGSKSLTPAQSQYFSQLTQAAATETLKAAVGVGSATNGPKEPISYVSAVNSGGYSANATNYPTSTPASYSATGEYFY